MDVDLPSFYYVMAVTDARARTNQFTEALPEAQVADLRAVQELHERESASGGVLAETMGRCRHVVFSQVFSQASGKFSRRFSAKIAYNFF